MQEARKGVVVVEEAVEQTVVAAEVALACKGAVFVQVVVVAAVEIAPDNKTEIQKTLDSDGVVLFLILHENKIIAYLLGEVMNLQDSRHVLFISYIYVVNNMRNKKLGCKLMSLAISYGIKQRCDGIMLIYNTSDRKLERFYDKYGFMLDFHLRRYELHDVYFKILP